MSKKQEIIRRKKIIIMSLIILFILFILLTVLSLFLIIKINSTKEVVSSAKSSNNGSGQEDTIIVDVPEEPDPEDNPQTEEPEKENPNEQDNKTTSSQDSKYYIKVNNQANVVTIYTKDKNGNYTVPYKAMLCSIGKATPSAGNIYTIPGKKWDRYIWGQMVGGVWAQYYVRINGSILFHSVPYTAKDKSTLEYWEYDKLGTKASAGCIRLTVEDAKWIYDNCPAGTKVEFYSDSNPGPLGKPTAKKISSEQAVRGWDPTDPDSKNPWKTYTPQKDENNNTNINDNSNTNNNNEGNTNNNVTNVTNQNNNNQNNNNQNNNNQNNNNQSDNNTTGDNTLVNPSDNKPSNTDNDNKLGDDNQTVTDTTKQNTSYNNNKEDKPTKEEKTEQEEIPNEVSGE